jgi:hypothetical protein
MNPAVELRRSAERLAGITRQQTLLRLGIAAAAGGVLLLVPAAGGSLPVLVVALVLLLTLAAMLLPHGWAPLVLLTGLAVVWARLVPDLVDVRSVPVAALLFTVHVLCTLTSYGPPEMRLPDALLLAWLRRTGVAVAGAAGAWLAVRMLAGLPESGWVLVVALAMLLGWTAFVTVRLLGRDGAPGGGAGIS